MTEKVYPIIVKMNTKEVQIGSAKVEFDCGDVINNYQKEYDVKFKDAKIQYKEGDFLTKVLSGW